MVMVLLVLFYFLFPALVIYLEKKIHLLSRIGAVVICYGVGLVIGNTGILPEGIGKMQEDIYSYCVILAIPMLLFSLDIRKWISMAGKTMLSLVLGLFSVIVMVLTGYFLFRDQIPDIWKVSGVLTGFYSGGAPNAAAISVALEMESGVFILTQTYDLVVGAVTLLFLMTVAQRFFLLFMRPYRSSGMEKEGDLRESYHARYESYDGIFTPRIFLALLLVLGLSILILGMAAGSSLLFLGALKDTYIILAITTLGIAASFIPQINKIEKSFQGGIYLILVFCLVFASMADISMFSMESVPLLAYVLLAVPAALLLHGILSRIFNVDVDNFLIISVALSMSPPFVPAVASALKNREIILPGLIVGLVGYAIGNYLGVLMGLLVKSFG